MHRRGRGFAVTAAVAGLSLTAAACGGGGDTGGAPQPSGLGTGNTSNAVKGGTLKLLGAGDIDHMDPVAAYYAVSYTLLRGISRQLVQYPNDPDERKASEVRADLAESVPEPTNDGRTYTFRIREGAQWDTPTGPRQVTAEDAVRGFKRLCNPVQPTGAPGYFTATIVGMQKYCDDFGKVKPDVASIRAFLDANEVPGVKALDDRTVEFTLLQPAGDFLNIVAMPFSSPAPVEVLQYLPDSPQYRQNFISNGPYKVTKYVAEKSIELDRNPAWKAETDPLRKAYVDKITITQGSDEGPVQQQLSAGTQDMSWDTSVPTADVPRLKALNDPKLSLVPDGASNPYVTINLQSPNAGGALKNVKVRQAINYAVNKKAIIQVLGGPTLYEPLGQILTPTILGYKKIDPYPTPESAGDPVKAKALLAEAGFPNGLDLIYLYRNRGKAPQIATTMQAELKKSGINLTLKQVPPADFYTQHLQKPEQAKKGDWDLAGPGWSPDWAGNSARSFFVALLDGRSCGEGSTNYNCYNNPEVNALIDKALSSSDMKVVEDTWAEADAKAMADAPWVPVTTGRTPLYHSERTQNWVYFPFTGNGDITNVWLK